mgnify:CR=1 FL=1
MPGRRRSPSEIDAGRVRAGVGREGTRSACCCSAPAAASSCRAARFAARFVEAGVALEAMDTGAACRTYNVLLARGRPAGAALLAVGLRPGQEGDDAADHRQSAREPVGRARARRGGPARLARDGRRRRLGAVLLPGPPRCMCWPPWCGSASSSSSTSCSSSLCRSADEPGREFLHKAIVPSVAWWFRHASTLTVASGARPAGDDRLPAAVAGLRHRRLRAAARARG